ncbi:MAG TPA: CARDB domain-containing protein [Flavisolibacter sp.]|jgi:hypothetical protein|nr:CARDB domain-containing protein [Flavisolibacter sp.]
MRKFLMLLAVVCLSLCADGQVPYPPSSAPVGPLVRAEYFFDTDPGVGKGSPLPLSPTTTLDQLPLNIELKKNDGSALSNGVHRLYVRTQDQSGRWSQTTTILFDNFVVPLYPQATPPVTPLIHAEYFFDTDPGVGKGKPLVIPEGSDLTNLVFEADVTGVAIGSHRIYVRTKDVSGNWSLSSSSTIQVEHPSGNHVMIGRITGDLCAGGALSIPFTVNESFGASNVFKAQLSNSNGSFDNPVDIGTLAGNQSGIIPAKIPLSTVAATGYRIRIIATAPEDTSAPNEMALTVKRVPGEFSITGDTAACFGHKTYTLSNAETDSDKYVWQLSGGGTLTANGTSASVNWMETGQHTITVTYTGGCAGDDSVKLMEVDVINTPLTGSFERMLPEDGNPNLSLPLAFSWLPIDGAKSYDLYIWEENGNRPTTPTVADIKSINHSINNSNLLQFEKTYKWQLVAKKVCFTLESPVQTFKLRNLPDLIVTQVNVPPTAFSSQSISINWEVKNQAQGGTLQKQWFDKVYLSTDAVLEPATDHYLGAVANPSELVYNASYTQTGSFTLPHGISDSYYVFVVTNGFEQLLESNLANNIKSSASKTSVQLTRPPDLTITSIVPKNVAFSGQNTELTWTVTNEGPGGTVATSWVDHVYIAPDSSLSSTQLVLLGSFPRSGALASQEAYTVTQSVKVPEGLFGTYFFYVKTDFSNTVYEHAAEANNTGISNSLQLILTPPVDLVLTQVTAPASASAKEGIPVQWKGYNQGGSSTNGQVWLDRVYLSKTATFQLDSSIAVGAFGRNAALEPEKEYTAQHNITVPANIKGNYYLYVHVNYGGSVYEYTHGDNNIKRSDAPIQIGAPDLTVTDIAAPEKDTSGTEMLLEWKLKNNGAGTVFNAAVVDRILLSPTVDLNPATTIELAQVSYITGNLLAGTSVAKQEKFQLPPGLNGKYYVFIQTDIKNEVEEIGKEDNNTTGSLVATTIVPGTWADLQVLAVTTTNTATAGEVIPLSYTVINKGEKNITDLQWNDRIYVSTHAEWDSTKAIYVREFTQARVLKQDSTYVITANITLPVEIGDSTYYVYVLADGRNRIYEHANEANNSNRSGGLFIKKYPPVDLAVLMVTAPANGSSGKRINVSWTVENKGETPTIQPQWSDALFLSADTTWNVASDILIKDFLYKGVLTKGQSYSNTQTVVLPNGVAGTFYLLMVSDYTYQNKDTIRPNNYRPVYDANGNPIQIAIQLTPPSNLLVAELNVPQERAAGQPVVISWKIKNTGTGTTAAASWTEKLYLSANGVIDQGDILLGSSVRGDSLKAQQLYSDSVSVLLPVHASGNYYVILKTDANDNVYEHGGEGDNTSAGFITVVKPLQSDLVVTSVIAPEAAIAGNTITLKWKVMNRGAFPAAGYMKEGIYLSEDSIKDNSDILLTSRETAIQLGPGAEILQIETVHVKGTSLRYYYVLVHTDVVNNMYESSDSNNVGYSLRPMKVDVEELAINSSVNVTLSNEKEMYYKINVSDTYTRETLLLSLKGATGNNANEIYLRYGGVPSRAVHDYAYSEAFSSDQEILVPELRKGTYYVLVYGKAATGGAQAIQLSTTIRNFELRSVSAAKGGNTGSVTIKLSGAKFDADAEVSLLDETRGTKMTATGVKYIDQATIYATFNLAGAGLGTYTVQVQNPARQVAKLVHGFEVVPGTDNIILTHVSHPSSTRPNTVFAMQIEFANNGNVDIPLTTKSLISRFKAPLGFSPQELSMQKYGLVLELLDKKEPLHVLRPGARAIITVYTKATNRLRFSLVK